MFHFNLLAFLLIFKSEYLNNYTCARLCELDRDTLLLIFLDHPDPPGGSGWMIGLVYYRRFYNSSIAAGSREPWGRWARATVSPSELPFFRVRCSSFHVQSSLHTCFLCVLSYLILAVPMQKVFVRTLVYAFIFSSSHHEWY